MNMGSTVTTIKKLKDQIFQKEEELRELKAQLTKCEADILLERKLDLSQVTEWKRYFSFDEYRRYGRQMIVPSIRIQGVLFIYFNYQIYLPI